MPPVTDSDANGQSLRIPAWRKFGLKLKSEQKTPQATNQSATSAEHSKRKREDAADEKPPKKTKKTKKNKKSPLVAEQLAPLTPNLLHRKSVTFTPETKAEDGDSIKQLFTSWVAEQKLQDPEFQLSTSAPVFQTPEPSQVEEEVDPALGEKERRVKRVKAPKQEKSPKPKSQKPAKVIKPITPSRPFLEHLRQYSELRATWKFNKNHQNHIIKHIFNLEVIPSDHAHFIYTYVRGLQGGVRTRLRDAALAIKVKDLEDGVSGFPEGMAEADKKQREYDYAMKEYVATMTASNASSKMGYEEGVMLGLSDIAMGSRAAKRMRAERILAELASSPDGSSLAVVVTEDDEDEKRARMNDGTVQKIARKRKQRTVVAEDESSSSSSSSSSSDSNESESDSDDSNSDDSTESTLKNNAEEASSSSSSSSSSESESGSGEDKSEDGSEEESESESD